MTTEAGAKIQPYFDIPPLTDPNVCVFTVIGEVIKVNSVIRVWITDTTKRELTRLLGTLNPEILSAAVLKVSAAMEKLGPIEEARQENATAFEISFEAYQALQASLPGVSDEHSFQLLAQHLAKLLAK